jgi:hypothetical protein
MAVKCPECGSEDLDLIEVQEDGRRRIACTTCGNEWLRGQVKVSVSDASPATGPKRVSRNYSPAEVQAHPNGSIHYAPALRWWSEEDDASSLIAPTLDNPYCIQPYDPAFFSKGTRGYDRECYVGEHPPGVDPEPKWMVKPHKPHWMSLCERHAKAWTGWDHRLPPSEMHTRVFLDDDVGYEDWTNRHGGYVLIQRKKSEYMLHLADCSHLGRESDNISLTEKPRRWAKKTSHLVEWANEKAGADPLRCTSCM